MYSYHYRAVLIRFPIDDKTNHRIELTGVLFTRRNFAEDAAAELDKLFEKFQLNSGWRKLEISIVKED